MPSSSNPGRRPRRRWLREFLAISLALIVVVLSAWTIAALYIDTPLAWLRTPLALGYGLAVLAALVFIRRLLPVAAVLAGGFCVVLIGWLSLQPSNDRHWLPDVDRTARAEIDGDRVTIHNVRNFDYHSETDYTPHWETRSVDLAQLQGADIFVTYWGSPWIAHPIVSFHFDDDHYLAVSIETRKEVGEEYSTVLGFFRQYELIYIVGDERDLIRLRSNYRQGEDVYLYRIRLTPQRTRAIFMSYLDSINQLHEQPQFYNALTSNCTTNIRLHNVATAEGKPPPWSWQLLLNGKADELLYHRGELIGDLPFTELKQQAHINDKARTAGQAVDFSRRIRQGLTD